MKTRIALALAALVTAIDVATKLAKAKPDDEYPDLGAAFGGPSK